ncbi:trypsin-like peptidase domain-containing protein, partial [Photorhabdus laumondii]
MLNDELEKLKSATVRVEEGSGVLINPYSTQYSYILTAKHVVEDISVDKIEVKNIEGRNISVLDKVEHPVIDVAILKVERLDGVEISHIENFYNQEKKLKFYGYPKNKRHNHIFREQLYSYDCLLHDIQGNTSVFTINELTQYEDIEGFSGGGIFFINEENQDVSLVAIEFEVSNTQAADSKINCIRIDAYLDFLQDKGWDEIKPIHLSSFKFYRDNIFENLDLENEDSLDVVKNLLKITLNNYKIFNSYYVTPNKIVEEFANRILAHNQDLKKLYDKELWCAFLEFFAIYLSIFAPDDEDSCNSNYLERLFLNFRFIYDHNNIKFRQI